MYKKFPIVLAFLIIGGGVLWLSIKPSVSLFNSKTEEATKEETEEISLEEFEIKDGISIFLLRLKEETNINFGEVKESKGMKLYHTFIKGHIHNEKHYRKKNK